MRKMKIDRIEGGLVICEEVTAPAAKKKKDMCGYGFPAAEVPKAARPGDYLIITDDGALKLEQNEKNK